MSSHQQSSSASPHFSTFPWGCKIETDPETDWPVSVAITHSHSTCECKYFGSDREIVRDFLIVVSIEFYHRKNPDEYGCKWSASVLPLQAQRLGIDLDTLKAGFEQSIPWRKSFRRFEVVEEADGKLVSFALPSRN